MDLKITDTKIENLPQINKTQQAQQTAEFSLALEKVSDDVIMQKLNGIIGEIKAQGKKIADHTDIRDMKQYRALIQEFINEVVSNSHKFSRENFLDRKGRHRVYGIVKRINEEVDNLAQELLKAEKDHIAILDKTGEILGLILDIII